MRAIFLLLFNHTYLFEMAHYMVPTKFNLNWNLNIKSNFFHKYYYFLLPILFGCFENKCSRKERDVSEHIKNSVYIVLSIIDLIHYYRH